MGSGTLKIEHQDPACQDNLCLKEYETAFQEHQDRLFRRIQNDGQPLSQDEAALLKSFDRFRQVVWGEGSYGDRIRVRVTPAAGGAQEFRLSDIAVQGLVTFADVQGLMDLGKVEFIIPDYFCGPADAPRQYQEWPVANRRDFQALLREMEGLRPLHGEGMGNVFWLRCMPDSVEPAATTGPVGDSQDVASLPSPQDSSSWLSQNDEDPCGDADVAYFDENTGRAVCGEGEDGEDEPADPTWRGKLGSFAGQVMVAMGDQAMLGVSQGLHDSFGHLGAALTHASLQIAITLGKGDSGAGGDSSDQAPEDTGDSQGDTY